MSVLLGIVFHFIGGFASGSFYLPYKRVRGWNWESFWIVGGLFSWLFIPFLAAWITIPDFMSIIRGEELRVLGTTYLFGLLWGIGGLTYGLGVRYLGVSLGSSIILGLCMVFGALIPALYYDVDPVEGKDGFGAMVGSVWGQTILLGLAVCLAGIAVCGRAGVRKERELPREATEGSDSGRTEYRFALGMTVALVSGVLSACFNFGLEAGQSMARTADLAFSATHPGEGGFLFRNNVVYVVLLWGGLTTNLVWCLALNARNRSFGDYTDASRPLAMNYLFSAIAGTTWFLQFFFYGMGESRLGNGPSSWILHMAFIILVANLWGLFLREWKDVSPSTRRTLLWGILLPDIRKPEQHHVILARLQVRHPRLGPRRGRLDGRR
jgi:L-rhamnose-H+ transport protein